MSNLYVPEYNDKTSLKAGQLPSPENIMARANLIKESGGFCCGEVWKSGSGYVPVYSFPRQLTNDEQEILCLANVTDKQKEIVMPPAL